MGAAAPDWMQDRLRAADERGGADAVRKEGVQLATELCAELLSSAFPACTSIRSTPRARPREIYASLGLGPTAS